MKRIAIKKGPIDLSTIKDDGVELWLFKVPKTLDPLSVAGKRIAMGETVAIGTSQFSIREGASLESDSIINIWPDASQGKLSLGKPFSKIVHISETPKTNTTDASQIVQNLASFLKFGTTRSAPSSTSSNGADTTQPELIVRYVPPGASLPSALPSAVSPKTNPIHHHHTTSPTKRDTEEKDRSNHKKHKEGKHKHKEGKHKKKE